MSKLEYREQVIDFVRKELIGPDPVAPDIQTNGEEILTIDPPRIRYSAGVLFPQETQTELTLDLSSDDIEKDEPNEEIQSTEIFVSDFVESSVSRSINEPPDEDDDPVSLANSFMPSAMGLTSLILFPNKGLRILVKAATYHLHAREYLNKSGEIKQAKQYLRIPLESCLEISLENIQANERKIIKEKILRNDGIASGLEINI